jgi:hypothetical protein
MSFIRKLRKQIEEKTEENRSKRLDAGEHARLEGLFKQLAGAKDKLAANKRTKKQEAASDTQQPEETKGNKPSPFASLSVVGGSPVKVNAKQYESLKQAGPFTQHITASGEMFPISITLHEGRKVVLPLANVVLGCPASTRVVQKNGEDADFTTENLMVVDTHCEPEPAPTLQDYRNRIAKLRKI